MSLPYWGIKGVGGSDAKEGVFRFQISRGWHLCGQCGALVDGLQGSYGYICCSYFFISGNLYFSFVLTSLAVHSNSTHTIYINWSTCFSLSVYHTVNGLTFASCILLGTCIKASTANLFLRQHYLVAALVGLAMLPHRNNLKLLMTHSTKD